MWNILEVKNSKLKSNYLKKESDRNVKLIAKINLVYSLVYTKYLILDNTSNITYTQYINILTKFQGESTTLCTSFWFGCVAVFIQCH